MTPLLALERFPPPDFGSGHTLPVNVNPGPRGLPLEYLDVVVLAVALGLATRLVLGKRSRRGVVGLGIFSVIYFGLYRKGCVCSIGSIQNVTLALADPTYAVPWPVLAFFLLPVLVALVFGRSFCAAVCPHGALQDLVLLKPVEVPPGLDRALRIGAAVYLGLGVMLAALGSAFIFCEYDPFIPIFRLTGSVGMVALGVGFLAVSTVVGRPYCRYLCPLGVVLGLAACVSRWRVRITPTTCDSCRLCERSCPVGAINKSSLPAAKPNRRQVAVALALLPVAVASCAGLGGWLGVSFSQKNSTVQLATRVVAEEAGTVEGLFDEVPRVRDECPDVDRRGADNSAKVYPSRRMVWDLGGIGCGFEVCDGQPPASPRGLRSRPDELRRLCALLSILSPGATCRPPVNRGTSPASARLWSRWCSWGLLPPGCAAVTSRRF
jgi:ferredoxin